MVQIRDILPNQQSEVLHLSGVIIEESALTSKSGETLEATAGHCQIGANQCGHAGELRGLGRDTASGDAIGGSTLRDLRWDGVTSPHMTIRGDSTKGIDELEKIGGAVSSKIHYKMLEPNKLELKE